MADKVETNLEGTWIVLKVHVRNLDLSSATNVYHCLFVPCPLGSGVRLDQQQRPFTQSRKKPASLGKAQLLGLPTFKNPDTVNPDTAKRGNSDATDLTLSHPKAQTSKTLHYP